VFKPLIEGLALGLSTGTVCFVTCAPIYLPWMMTEQRGIWKSLQRLLEISAGRFVAYILFGALAGYFGSNIEPLSRELFTGISYILLSAFLVLNAFRTHREGKSCRIPGVVTVSKSAFLLGLFTGINFCPSFLIALSSAVNLGGVVSGMEVFLGFFFGTSVFLLPLALSSYLSILKEVKVLARIASILIALWFIYQGVFNLHHVYQEHQHEKNTYLLDLAEYPFQPVIVASLADSTAAFALRDSLLTIYQAPAVVLPILGKQFDSLTADRDHIILLVFAGSLKDTLVAVKYQDYHHIVIEQGNSHKVPQFLRKTRFKLDIGQKMRFRI
jgi:sulfite exporter TauE/SafE